jgi:hypothetical protein
MPTTDTPTVILRSTFVGIASLIVAAGASLFVGFAIALREAPADVPPGGAVGVDLLLLVRDASPTAILLPLLAFPIGFYLGFRYFSKSAARR